MGKRIGKKHYKVTFTMILMVVDRDLQCESDPLLARPKAECRVMGLPGNANSPTGYAIYGGQVRKKCRINIASGFRPGVK